MSTSNYTFHFLLLKRNLLRTSVALYLYPSQSVSITLDKCQATLAMGQSALLAHCRNFYGPPMFESVIEAHWATSVTELDCVVCVCVLLCSPVCSFSRVRNKHWIASSFSRSLTHSDRQLLASYTMPAFHTFMPFGPEYDIPPTRLTFQFISP